MINLPDSFFNPRGISVIGASSDPNKLGYAFPAT
jgi:acyl-CoA synthetase (NDP forming)